MAGAILLLAAGTGSRMGESRPHKTLLEFKGVPLIRLLTERAVKSVAEAVVVVTGHRRDEIAAAIDDLPVTLVHNSNYASGMATSLTTGFSAEKISNASGILVMLADMPGVLTSHLDAMMSAFLSAPSPVIVRATSGPKQGNPIILPNALFDQVMRLQGDIGARDLIAASNLPIIDIDIGVAAQIDIDTPQDEIVARRVFESWISSTVSLL